MKNIIEKAKQYKKKVAGGYLSITQDDINSKITGDKIYVSTKIDGIFNVLHFDGEKSVLINGNGVVIDNIALLEDASKALNDLNIKSITVAGELHIANELQRCRVSEVVTALASSPDKLLFSVFDILDINNEEYIQEDYEKVIEKIANIFNNSTLINPVSVRTVNSKEVMSIYEEIVVANGEEGLVIRIQGMPIIYKAKPLHTLDLAIIGFTEGEENKVRELLLGLLNEEKQYIQVGRVGTGLSEELKSELFKKLDQNKINSSYFEADKRRVAFAMVKPTIVIEVSINELTVENSKGFIKNQLLSYDETKGYEFVSSTNGTSLVHPVFKRVRDDKSINLHDIRYKQITDIVYIDNTGQLSKKDLPKSEIIFREVYTKATKGKTNVQKFIVWKTNKENIDNKYPAYVMNYTNFSPSRLEPLKKDVRVSSSKVQILELLEVFKTKNIKKGWNLV